MMLRTVAELIWHSLSLSTWSLPDLFSRSVWPGVPLLMLGLFLAASAARADFQEGHIFVAGSRNAAVFEFDSDFDPVGSWTHPSFGTSDQAFTEGPAGMGFDADGNLVVAAKGELCVFSAPGVLVGCKPKAATEPTENLVFDLDENAYTTTSTGGSDQIQKYDANLDPVATFSLPMGDLTGITCDPSGDLYVGSADCGCIYKVDPTTFAVLDMITGFGKGTFSIEGIQYTFADDLLVARTDVSRIDRVEASSPLTILDMIDAPSLLYPVPLTIDNQGNVYTADFESTGLFVPEADLFEFDSSGALSDSVLASDVKGPFGMVVAGTVLPCGAFRGRTIPASSGWSVVALVLLLPAAALVSSRRLPRSG